MTTNEFKKHVEALIEKWHTAIAPPQLEYMVVWNEYADKDYGISGCVVDEKYLYAKYECSITRLPMVHQIEPFEPNWVELEKEILHEVCHTLTWEPHAVILRHKIYSPEDAEIFEERNTVLVERAIWAAYHMEPEEE